jgi:hypothetical protein
MTPPEDSRQPEHDDGGRAYLPIGLVFCVLGLAGLVNDSMRPSAFAFFPIGITFLILGMRGQAGDEPEEDAPGTDLTPR